MTKTYLNSLTYKIIGACIEVHRELGAGLLESVYHKCLKHELSKQGLSFQSELKVQIFYKDSTIETELRCDFLVENCIVIELKAVEVINPIHEAQLLTYMKLLKVPKGILINFNCVNLFKSGQKTFVNDIFTNLPD